jgi:hypothetical protein
MILDNIIEKVSEACCAGADGMTSTTTKPEPTEDVLDTNTRNVVVKKKTVALPAGGFTDKETKFEFCSWTKLPDDMKKAAAALGYNEQTWDDDACAPCDNKHWDKFSKEEREGAEALGWDEDAWDHKYEHSDFCEIPDHVKRAAESLGFDQAMWDEDRWPDATKDKDWDDLTDTEKSAYAVFGYTKPSWDEE